MNPIKLIITFVTLLMFLNPATLLLAEEIDFTPHAPNKYDVEEYWHIKDGKLDEFVTYYRETVYPYLTRLDGYRGWTVKTPLPEKGSDGKFGWLELGPPDTLFPVHPGIRMDSTIRTDRSVHLHALLKDHYNLIIIHHLASDEALTTFIPELEDMWAKDHGGNNMWDDLSETFFSRVINHWDTIYRVTETSIHPHP
jgi:hypothetical protein